MPRYACWFDEVGWDLENYGAEPEIEVLNVPGASGDAQLETAVRSRPALPTRR